MVQYGTRSEARSPLLCTACVLAGSEYTGANAPLFLSYKMMLAIFWGPLHP